MHQRIKFFQVDEAYANTTNAHIILIIARAFANLSLAMKQI